MSENYDITCLRFEPEKVSSPEVPKLPDFDYTSSPSELPELSKLAELRVPGLDVKEVSYGKLNINQSNYQSITLIF